MLFCTCGLALIFASTFSTSLFFCLFRSLAFYVRPCLRAAAKARGSNLRVHYKHMREVAHLIKGMKLSKAKVYLQVGCRLLVAVYPPPCARCTRLQSKQKME